MSAPINSITVTIQRALAALTIQGFGTGLMLAKNAAWSGMRVFSSLTEAASGGVVTNSTLYRMIEAYFAGDTRPARVKVWGFTSAAVWGANLKVISVPAIGTIVTVAIVLPGGTVRTGTYTVASGNTAADIAAGLHASIDPQEGVSSSYTLAADNLNIAADTTTDKLRIQSMHDCLEYLDNEGDCGYTAALNAAKTADSDFYAVMVESTSKANLEFVAAWVQANKRLAFLVTHDSREMNAVGGAGTVGLSLKTSGYDRTDLQFKILSEKRADAAMAGVVLARTWDTGTAPVWAYRNLPGIDADSFTSTQLANLVANNVGVYTTEHGRAITWIGKTPSGTFGDFIVFLDWVDARVGEAVFNRLSTELRMGYSAEDIGKVRDDVFGVLELLRQRRGISPDFPMTVTAPAPTGVSPEERAARILGGGGIQFQCTYSGGFYYVNVNGTVLL